MTRVLVMSADPAIRDGWSRQVEAGGSTTIRCVGPRVLCVLLTGDGSCPLHSDADVALYDENSVTPELMLKLVRTRTTLPIALAKDALDEGGRHEPKVTKIVPTADVSGFRSADLGSRR